MASEASTERVQLTTIEDVELTEEEVNRYWYVQRADLIGSPFLVVWFFVLSTSTAQKDADLPTAAPPTALLVAQGIMAFVAVMTFLYHTQTWPTKHGDDIFNAIKYIGRWLFLTRHCLSLQAVHMTLSFYAAWTNDAYVQQLVYGSSLWIGGLGFFVTIQYFLLVHNNPEFVAKCKDNVRLRGFFGLLDFRGFMGWLHIPALPLACFDTIVAKRHSFLLEGAVSLPATAAMIVFYCCFYVGLVLCNYAATGYYPYAILKGLQTVPKWLAFIFGQAFIMVVFCAICWGFTFVPQPWF